MCKSSTSLNVSSHGLLCCSHFLAKVNRIRRNISIYTHRDTAVILIRAHAFTGRKKITFWALLAGFIGLTAGNIYVFGTQFVGRHVSAFTFEISKFLTASSDLNVFLGPSGCYGDNKVTMHGEVFLTKNAAGIGVRASYS
jgi:hypothetical protein